jgi:hypothetical protein
LSKIIFQLQIGIPSIPQQASEQGSPQGQGPR